MMKAVQTSETSVTSYQSTRRYNPENSYLPTHRLENLMSYQFISSCGILADIEIVVIVRRSDALLVWATML
jgi:hypothetical protein